MVLIDVQRGGTQLPERRNWNSNTSVRGVLNRPGKVGDS